MRSLTGCTPWVANPPDSVKDKRLRRACGILDSTSRAAVWQTSPAHAEQNLFMRVSNLQLQFSVDLLGRYHKVNLPEKRQSFR